QRNQGQDKEHRAGDRIGAERVGNDQEAEEQRQKRNNIKQNVGGYVHDHLGLHTLGLGFVSLLLPLADFIPVDAAQGQQFFFVVNHLAAARTGQGIIFHQEDGFLGADFLA